MSEATTVATEPATLARFFRVLGDPTRVRLIRLLEDGERPVGELVEAIGDPQPRVSTHLACLRHCGFVETERRGREIFYRLKLAGLEGLLARAAEVSEPECERLAGCTRVGPDWI
jgi:DNA-binding transcriptional ArsR family regulator